MYGTSLRVYGTQPCPVEPSTTNRHVKWLDMDGHGFGVLDVTAERSQMDYYLLSDRADPGATASWLRSYRTRRGTQRVERVDAPVA